MGDYITPYSTWKHLRTGSFYTVLGVAQCSTNGNENEISVVYISHKYQALRYREISEFMDGRFEMVVDQPCSMVVSNRTQGELCLMTLFWTMRLRMTRK